MTVPAERPEVPRDLHPVLDVGEGSAFDGHLLRVVAGDKGSQRTDVREREARYRAFLDALGVAVYTTDAKGRITFFNRAATSFWGRTPSLGELWCGSLRMYTTDGLRLPHDACPMAIALTEQRTMHGAEAIAERPDGSRVWFTAYPTPLHGDAGDLVGAVNVLIDVTERRRAEQQLRDTADALERSNTVKDEFLGLVSHELRTPVTTILGNARLLRDRGEALDDDVKQGMLDDISEDADRLHTVVENLLTLTRLGTSPEVEHEPLILARIVQRAVDAYRHGRPERVIRLEVRDPALIVEGDAAHLELLLGNLLSNADKYSPPAQPIEVLVAPSEDAGEVTVRVLDRGIGLDGATTDELLQPFYRTAAARRHAGGIGIGLAVCRRIVESMGGRIWAAPRDGGGSEFGIALPVTPVSALDLPTAG